jgi:DnaJ-class molecular chaperone
MRLMPPDPYQTLGVARDATADQIRSAYRTLAKKHHPDLNPGNKAAEEKFKAIGGANDLLSDPEKRARFDRGEIDGAGQERPESGYRHHADGPRAERYRRRQAAAADDPVFADMFSDMFRRGGGGGPQGEPIKMRGQDQHFSLEVEFIEAASGAARRLNLPDGRTLDVTIPPGMADGQSLRLRGQGESGWNGGPAGDALIEISIRPHPFFRREADDIHLDLPVTTAEAVLGGKVPVPTLSGQVALTIPAHSDSGRVLRLRGRGIPAHGGRPAGDLYVTLKLVAGTPDAELEAALKAWAERHKDENPRAAMEAAP